MIAKLVWAVALAASVGVLGGCSDDETIDDPVMPVPGGTGGTPATATTVNVTVQDYQVILSTSSASAGLVTFSVYNQGNEEHEFVVVQTALAPDALPTNMDGSFNDQGEGVVAVDQIEKMRPGTTQVLQLTLEAGPYVLLCNLVTRNRPMTGSHYQQGMYAPFTVN